MRKLLLLVTLLAMLAVSVLTVWGAPCEERVADISDCGNTYPPPGCVMVIYEVDNLGCCSPPAQQYQFRRREWWDCDENPDLDCEYHLYYHAEDLACP